MRINRLLFMTLPLAFFFSCQKELTENPAPAGGAEDLLMTKALNTSVNSDPTSILAFLKEEPSAEMMERLYGQGVISVEKVFTSNPKHADLERKYNLDKWYVFNLSNRITNEKAASMLASESSVASIQFNTYLDLEPDSPSHVYVSTPHMSAAGRAAAFNDPLLHDQWHYINIGDKSISPSAYAGGDINVKDAWKLCAGDPDLVVAVVDEGVMFTHPDLEANMWTNTKEIPGNNIDDDGNGFVDDIHGYNFVTHSPELTWYQEHEGGHGTHVAGTVAAVNNNGVGVAGVAGGSGKGDGVKIMSCQIFSNGRGAVNSTAGAFKYAADNGACILQCSFGMNGGDVKSDSVYESNMGAEVAALNYFREVSNYPAMTGGLAIFAAGNESQPYASYPGALRDNICVSAFGPDFLPASYTNYGPGCNITAPGGDPYVGDFSSGSIEPLHRAEVLSTIPDPANKHNPAYGYKSGTSMACPHVSGIAALGLSYARKLGKTYTAKQYTDMLLSSTDEFDSRLKGVKKLVADQPDMQLSNYFKQMGTGAINTWRFFMQIEGIPSLTVVAGERQMIDLAAFFGSSAVNLTYLTISVDEDSVESLGLEKDPELKFGKLFIEPTKVGSGKLTITAIAGGSEVGGGPNIGGMEISQEISVISRSYKSSNGGWL